MSLLRSASLYAVANAVIALVGVVLTMALGRQLGPDGFGVWASFFAIQNVWAALGFLRLEVRLASCTTIVQADRIVLSGFAVGTLVTGVLCLSSVALLGLESTLWLALIAGFGTSILDALIQRHAFGGHQLLMLTFRAIRVLLPITTALAAALSGLSVDRVIACHGWMGILFPLLLWRRWILPARWLRLAMRTMLRYRRELIPSLVFATFNGLWINGLTPALNHFSSPAIAGQFAMLQRLLGGAMGLVSTAITLMLMKKDFVHVKWSVVQRVLYANIALCIGVCITAAIPILGLQVQWLGAGWQVSSSLFFASSVFLTACFAVGAISIVAIRLRDEWFMAIWQLLAVLCWVGIYLVTSPSSFIVPSLLFGALMYAVLYFRWHYLATVGGAT